MVAKLFFSKWKATLFMPSIIASAYGMPLMFYWIIPGFNGPGFPAILISYIVFIQSLALDQEQYQIVSRVHLPISARQLVLSDAVYQLSLIAVALLTAAGFVLLTGQTATGFDAVGKAVAVSFFFLAVVGWAQTVLPKHVAQRIGSAIIIAVVILAVGKDTVFLPGIQSSVLLAIGVTSFIAATGWSLAKPAQEI